MRKEEKREFRDLLEKMEINKEEIRKKKEERKIKKVVKQIMRDVSTKEKEARLRNPRITRYTYKDIRSEDILEYFKGKKKKKERILIARYRCGNEMKGG